MSFWRKLKYLLPWHRRAAERDMQDEMESLAAIAPRRELGNLTLAAESARAQWGWPWLAGIAGDVRYAIRVLARRPGFTAIAIVSLGLGIGANAAIFSLMDALLLRLLPVHEPERLVNFDNNSFSYFAFGQYQANSSGVLSGVLATTTVEARDLDTSGEPRRGRVELVSGNYFELLGVAALIGRTLAPADERRGATELAAVISYGYWQRAYGGNPAVLGRTLRVQKVPFTIVGVAPAEFFGVAVGEAADAWLPLTGLAQVFPGRQWLDRPSTNFLLLFGRLQPGITAAAAGAALTPLARRIDIQRAGPGLPAWIRKQMDQETLTLFPAANGISFLRRRFSQPLRVVFAMVAIGLLLACVNLMSLQFARTDERRRELSVRLAIGAGRLRIVRQLMIEALLLAFAGGLAGLAICRPVAASLTSFFSQGGATLQLDLRTDPRMLLFVLALSTAAAVVFGIVPALRATRGNLAPALNQTTRAVTAAPVRKVLGRAIVSLQFALSLLLIASAFLFAFSLYKLTHFDTGLDRRHLAVVDVDATEAGYRDGADLVRLNHRLLERIAAMPGVESATFSENGIYSGRNSNTQVGADGFQAPNGPQRNAFYDQVGPRYFSTIGARLISGRDFDDRDNVAAPKVVIVNETFVRHFFAGKNPVGQNIYRTLNDDKTPYQVVGVVRDMRSDVRQRPQRYFYRPHFQTQSDLASIRFVVRTRPDPANLFPDLRAAIRGVDSGLRIVSMDAADDLLGRTMGVDRLIGALSFGFGILALTLAAVGVYGLLAYEATRRTGEIGIRMALGASRSNITTMMLREVVMVAAVGIIAGLGAALALGRLFTALVFETKPLDPRIVTSAALVLAGAALGAAWLPARRAARMDPMAALRTE